MRDCGAAGPDLHRGWQHHAQLPQQGRNLPRRKCTGEGQRDDPGPVRLGRACQYAGKVLLVVNTASYCGFTSQYEGLEKLYAELKDRGLVVLGFPSNDFGAQEPGSDKEIADFCRLTYGVEFPMVSKTVVKGPQTNAFYKRLGEITGSQPRWNFHKYLISRDGGKVIAYGSATSPDDPALRAQIEIFLKP